MIKPDIIVCQPKDILYPWWMTMMKKNRHLFGKVIVIMTQSSTPHNFTHTLSSLPDINLIESFSDDGRDWRNAAITEAIKHSTATHILFLEQDFLFVEGFLERIFDRQENIGFTQGNRLHPAFLLVSRFLLNQTHKDFSIDPDKGDHFSKITAELKALHTIQELPDDHSWIHLEGTTQNYRMDKEWHHASQFMEYNTRSLRLEQQDTWRGICAQKIEQMRAEGVQETYSLERFFV